MGRDMHLGYHYNPLIHCLTYRTPLYDCPARMNIYPNQLFGYAHAKYLSISMYYVDLYSVHIHFIEMQTI